MPIDKYQPCPCGSGKKIKFCCSADIVAELDEAHRRGEIGLMRLLRARGGLHAARAESLRAAAREEDE